MAQRRIYEDHRYGRSRPSSNDLLSYPGEVYSEGRQSRPRERRNGYTPTMVKEYLEYPDGTKVEVSPGYSQGRRERASSQHRLRRPEEVYEDRHEYPRERRHRSYDALLDESRRYEYGNDRRVETATIDNDYYGGSPTLERNGYTRRYEKHQNGARNRFIRREGRLVHPETEQVKHINDKYRIISRKMSDNSSPPPALPPRQYLPETRVIENRGREMRYISPSRRYGSPERQRKYLGQVQYPQGY